MSEEHRKKYFPSGGSNVFSFYDTKDGDDCLKKTFKLSGYTGAIGTTFALVSGLTSTTADNPALASNVLIRLTKYGLPMFAAGGMFAATTCTVANLRGGKDDPFNHFAGGMATGSVFGTAFKSQKLGWGLGFAFAFLAMIWKAGKIEGFTNFDPNEYRRERTLGAHNRSYFTKRPNPEGNPHL